MPEGNPGAITSSPDGSRLYVSLTNLGELGSGVISVLDSETLQEVAKMQVPGHYPYAGKVWMNAAGTKGYLGTNSGNVQVFDAASNTMTTSIPTVDPQSIAFSPDGARVYITGYNNRMTVVDAQTDTVVDEWVFDPAYGTFGDLEIDPTGSFAYVGGRRTHSVYVVDLASGAVAGSIEVGGPPGTLSLTKDGKSLYVTDAYNEQTIIVDTATRSIRTSFFLRIGYGFLLSETEDRAFVTTSNRSRVDVIDLTTNAMICSHSLLPDYQNSPQDIALSPDGRRMYVANTSHNNNTIIALAVPEERNAAFRDIPSGTQFERDIRWTGNAGVATGYEDGTYRPLEPVRRDAMAAFLYRFHGSPDFVPPSTSPFVDLRTTDKFYKEITWLASMGISAGWPDGTYRPLQPVNRDAMAAFMFRTVNTANFSEPADSPYKDVKNTDQFYREMAFMSAAGVTTGWPDGTFRPLEPVSRDAMAALLYRLNPLAPTNLTR
ncbi:S-layer homology domain-containing protein [Arthrobacter sp. zg-Y820]|uniref:S-layer homology domain-containing protein n=1 Tax=unclassified Arthrobacter TaxID=235627 RepID=UPI002540BE9D|nr:MULTISPECIES: S-layer homology domain-containing protein [unclassified Arthrobacter]WIB10943.1 S-layer homology domain-containing protein [Arthrobacter sp. zg-Y820]